jgi:hypothetical protein
MPSRLKPTDFVVDDGVRGKRNYGSVNEWTDDCVGDCAYEVELNDFLRLGLVKDGHHDQQEQREKSAVPHGGFFLC